jgi:membrane-associated PAP2 superfamily phosphatase
MKLFRTALLLGVGYALGRPAVRQELLALVERRRGLRQPSNMINLGDREWTQLVGAAHPPAQSGRDGGGGHPSSGLQWPRPHTFPRYPATPGRRR